MSGISIAVTHTTHQTTFYEVSPDQGWKVDAAMRCIVIGRGVPRTYVPLDGVLYFELTPAPVVARPAPQTEGERDHETD